MHATRKVSLGLAAEVRNAGAASAAAPAAVFKKERRLLFDMV